MDSGRYRVTVNGFKVLAETWDDVFEWDGKRDEVYISAIVRKLDRDGNVQYASSDATPVLGDINNQNGRVQAGSASPRGGLRTGDSFPTPTPWMRSQGLDLRRNWPPYTVWEGDLTDGKDVVLITPAVNEWDPGASALEGWLVWADDAVEKLGPKIAALIGGPLPAAIVKGLDLGLDLFMSLRKSGVIGKSADRPIGMTPDPKDSTKFVFNPQVLVLNYQTAEKVIADAPAGKGPGVLAFDFPDDPYLRGHYQLWVQVERLDLPNGNQPTWHGPEDLGGACQYGLAAASWAPDRLDVFTVGTDGQLYQRYRPGDAWSFWEAKGGNLVGAPGAVAWAAGRVDAFAINAADRMLHHTWWDGSRWQWEAMTQHLAPLMCGYGAAVASQQAGHLNLFAIGADGHLQHAWWDGQRWNGWEDLGGSLGGAPGAVSWGPNRVDVFTLGTNRSLQHLFWDGQRWSGWEDLGGTWQGGVTVASQDINRLDVFTIGTDGTLHRNGWDGIHWSGFQAVASGYGAAAPGAVSSAPGRLDAFAIRTDRAAEHRWLG
jgi:hypothetical protein